MAIVHRNYFSAYSLRRFNGQETVVQDGGNLDWQVSLSDNEGMEGFCADHVTVAGRVKLVQFHFLILSLIVITKSLIVISFLMLLSKMLSSHAWFKIGAIGSKASSVCMLNYQSLM